ncbi:MULTISPECIES: P-loop ATPase, Sll1717 family [unclassified Massilia]|uniref:P-loop ATPase, Sll1717 family n=1 Tax=unclassified Massilia TaxID=2609279 RepID=UPI00177E6F74|nr:MULTISPECIES: hypothetical protein [unclassified Massilia]MBD8531693.1 hypothetical protein [Massilia sp. CFBP 13647]MBD8675138.1 hypothetical protein [Massilia sp. CFBP 13721]
MHRRDFLSNELFGNEAGDDEDLEVLNSYFLDKPEFDSFYSVHTKLAFARSRKGMGKSALLKQTMYLRQQEEKDDLLVYVKASDLIALQNINTTTPAELVHAWQQRICTLINLELGATLNVGLSDDSMLLVESSELAGFRNRNIVGALLDRLKIKGLGAEIERTRVSTADSQAVLERVMSQREVTVWLFIDDVDATFLNTESERLKASTFFSACRNLVSVVRGLCIRAAVRTDVWSVLTQYDEALDKCEQYMIDLNWSTEETGRIIENKIVSFFRRTYPDNLLYQNYEPAIDGAAIRKIIFKEPFAWGTGRFVDSFRPIHILSAGRPRWAAQLCKLAAKTAYKNSSSLITINHIHDVLQDYGKFRVDDLYKEHRHQCAVMQDIVESFAGGQRRFATDALLEHIAEKIIRRIGIPKIDGITAAEGPLSVAHFLFRCGFIAARDDQDPSGLGFIKFEDRPNLLSVQTNLDDNLVWEIHPSYRHFLRIQGTRGAETF